MLDGDVGMLLSIILENLKTQIFLSFDIMIERLASGLNRTHVLTKQISGLLLNHSTKEALL